MTSKRRLTGSLFAMGCAMLVAGSGSAATTSGTIAVSLTIASSCTLSTNPLAFGVFNVATGNTSSTTLSLNCTNALPWSTDIDAGLNQNIANGPRRVTNGGGTPGYVNYHLFKDAGRTLFWGTTSSGTALAGVGTGLAQTLTVFADANGASGLILPGTYADTVTVTVTF